MQHLVRRTKQAAFTLVELVIVIVIMGILAAFIAPKMANLTEEAKQASKDATLGALRSAANAAHALQKADSSDTDGSTSVTMDGSTITMVNGYPTADSAGIEAAMNTADITAASAAGVTTYTVDTNCTVTYTASASLNAFPAIANGTVTACDGS